MLVGAAPVDRIVRPELAFNWELQTGFDLMVANQSGGGKENLENALMAAITQRVKDCHELAIARNSCRAGLYCENPPLAALDPPGGPRGG